MSLPAKVFPALCLSACVFLTACGGGGSASNGNLDNGASTTITVAGKVIDGYLEGATVCLDLNTSLTCDSDEPAATSKADGSYSLDVSKVDSANFKTAHLLTVVPSTAKDADDAGKTLAEAGKPGFSLLAPAAAYVKADGSSVVGAVISPFTTLVSHEMISSNNTLDTSEKYVRERLSLAVGTDLRQDFVAKKDTVLADTAQMLAAAMGSVKAAALADTTSAPNDKQALLAALTYLQIQGADLQKAYAAAKASNSAAKPLDLVKTALQSTAAKPVTADLVAEAKKITSSSMASAALDILEQGIYQANESGCSISNLDPYCMVRSYAKLQGSGGKINLFGSSYYLNGAAWIKDPLTDPSVYLTSSGWLSETSCSTGQSTTYAAESNGGTTIYACDVNTYKLTARMSDANGKTLAALGLNQFPKAANVTMPSDSLLYWFDVANVQDSYSLYVDSKMNQTINGVNKFFTSFTDFISTYSTSAQGLRVSWGSLYFSFDAGGSASGGTVTVWSSYSGGSKKGSAPYERRQVFGQELLFVKAPIPENDKGTELIFAVKDGFLYGGEYRPAAVKSTTEAFFNKTMMNAILAADNKPAVVN